MVERRIELDRRYHRKEKMRKLKAKLATATGEAREKILYKINRLSPFWTEASLTQSQIVKVDGGETGASAAAAESKKKPAPPKKKA